MLSNLKENSQGKTPGLYLIYLSKPTSFFIVCRRYSAHCTHSNDLKHFFYLENEINMISLLPRFFLTSQVSQSASFCAVHLSTRTGSHCSIPRAFQMVFHLCNLQPKVWSSLSLDYLHSGLPTFSND